jgi:hypothetical protein
MEIYRGIFATLFLTNMPERSLAYYIGIGFIFDHLVFGYAGSYFSVLYIYL